MNVAPLNPPHSGAEQSTPRGERLPVGMVAEARVISSESADRSGRLEIQGRTFEASLPPGLRENQRVLVEVLQHDEVLRVRIVNASAGEPTTRRENLETYLTRILQSLPTTPPSRTDVQRLYELLLQFSKGVSLHEIVRDGMSLEVLLKNIFSAGLVTEDTITSPEKLRALIEGLSTQFEGKTASKNAVAGHLMETLVRLEQVVKGVFHDEAGADGNHLFLKAINQLVHSLNIQSLAMAVEKIMAKISPQNGSTINLSYQLQALVQVLRSIDEAQILELPGSLEQLSQYARQLSTSDLKSTDKERLLRSIAQQLFGDDRTLKEGNSRGRRGELMQLQSSLEALASTQELLKQLNLFLQQINEPITVLLPAALKDMFWLWSFRFDAVYHKEEESSSSAAQYHRFTLNLSFPAIGAVEVRCAHSENEALINLCFDSEAKVEFVDQFSHFLKFMFQQQGIEQSLVINRIGGKQPQQPFWLNDLEGTAIVA